MAVKRRRRIRPLKPVRLTRHENAYAARINLLIGSYRQLVLEHLDPILSSIVEEFKVHLDDETDLIEAAFKKIREAFSQRLTETAIKRAVKESSSVLNRRNREHHAQQINRVLGVNPIQTEPWLESEVNNFISENVSLIKTLPEEAFSDIEQMVFRDGRRGLSAKKIRENIVEQFNTTQGRAKVIARDQISKFNGRLTELRQKQSGIDRYTWQTSKDGRVRSDHQRLDGKIFSWDDPPVTITTGKRAGERNHPGQDILCRCNAIPVFEDLL